MAAFVEKGRMGEEETLKRDGEKAIYTQRGTNEITNQVIKALKVE